MTTALEGGERSASRPGRTLPPGKTRYPLYRRLGGPQGRSGQVRKISPPSGILSPDRPARSQLLYRLSYSAHVETCSCMFITCTGVGLKMSNFHAVCPVQVSVDSVAALPWLIAFVRCKCLWTVLLHCRGLLHHEDPVCRSPPPLPRYLPSDYKAPYYSRA